MDVEWRLDYQVHSSATGREHDPLYIIKLKTVEGGSEKPIEFTATREQLHDLLAKSKDALAAVDRLAGPPSTKK